MIKITCIFIILSLLTRGEIKAQHPDLTKEKSTNKCVIEISIDQNQKIYIQGKTLSKTKVYKSIQKLYQKCKQDSEVRIESNGSYTDIDFFDNINELAFSAIEDSQNELSLKRYGRPMSEITHSEWYP